jgi:hypothetical protein
MNLKVPLFFQMERLYDSTLDPAALGSQRHCMELSSSMGSRVPFVGRIFWKVLPVVLVLVVIGFAIAVRFFDYEIMRADYGGALISSVILSYLVHLWLLPGPYQSPEDEPPSDDS